MGTLVEPEAAVGNADDAASADALILLEGQLKHGESGAPRSWTSR